MTIIATDGPSTAPNKESEEVKSPYTTTPAFPEPHGPPSYAETFPGDEPHAESQEGASTVELPKSSNHVNIFKQSGAITGTWVIDTNLPVPLALIQPSKTKANADHLSLVTKCGAIDATVYLRTINGKKASLHIDTQCGQVTVRIPSRVDYQPFKLHAVTRTGAMYIWLPRDFRGPLKHTAKCGSILFSDEVQKNLTTYGSHGSFVGGWEGSGFSDYEGWLGDEVDAMSSCGIIKFSYADEIPEVEEGIGEKIQKVVDRTVNSLFGWVALR
ncbi:hypothetical protein CPB86DRAFT_749327 [Serendipita vermifera]|nr:hypothetical protein CPB86DRAFT_749327 [Serendipita vermifera]